MAGGHSVANPTGPPRSFASFFKQPGESKFAGNKQYKIVTYVNGAPILELEDDEYEKLIAPHRWDLVGKFSYGRPKMEEVRSELEKVGFQGDFHIGLMNPRHILIRFEREEDFQRCWIQTMWNIKGYAMRILKCQPDFRFEEDPPVIPIWVALHELPIEFLNPQILFSVATTIGKHLQKIGHNGTVCKQKIGQSLEHDVKKFADARQLIEKRKAKKVQPDTIVVDIESSPPKQKETGIKKNTEYSSDDQPCDLLNLVVAMSANKFAVLDTIQEEEGEIVEDVTVEDGLEDSEPTENSENRQNDTSLPPQQEGSVDLGPELSTLEAF
ncbi:OLC1v1035941C1 [Oldenlandia corymbosa var. corymbosa]|uniref:OLC1v1035941C1 n=1 Tax=Oldenlandia corymbosa var. corymbosa TaxID=529605 RepID=A0AAV1CU86_OLDCO|nr:OLC1v1035941C1 [Oldenlandia corymbosa var. corymbosa]